MLLLGAMAVEGRVMLALGALEAGLEKEEGGRAVKLEEEAMEEGPGWRGGGGGGDTPPALGCKKGLTRVGTGAARGLGCIGTPPPPLDDLGSVEKITPSSSSSSSPKSSTHTTLPSPPPTVPLLPLLARLLAPPPPPPPPPPPKRVSRGI